MRRILLSTFDPADTELIEKTLGHGFQFHRAGSPEEFESGIKSREYDQVFVHSDMFGTDCREVEQCRSALLNIWERSPQAEVIVIGEPERIRRLVNFVKAGASDYLTHPVHPEVLAHVLEELRSRRKVLGQLQYFYQDGPKGDFRQFMEQCSPPMWEVFNKVRAVADTKTLILLLGETGVGKGWLAKLIHRFSNRAQGPFICVHCGSIPESLFESELFGHERGAFTGADRLQIGKLELAAKGTVLLDEVGTMSSFQQVKLLHVLQEKCFQRVGGSRDIPLEARVIAATNADIKSLTEKKEFRKDLYYRLNAFVITIPPLRDRAKDIDLLVGHFLKEFNLRHGKNIQGLHSLTAEAIKRYAWPGNVRELENVLERAYLLEKTKYILPENLPLDMFSSPNRGDKPTINTNMPLEELKKTATDRLEQLYILRLLEEHGGRVDRTAKQAGISTRHLRTLIHKHGIDRSKYKPHS